jgi:IS5 family transposase
LRASFCDHSRRAKRRAYQIKFSQRRTDLRAAYRDLIGVAQAVHDQAHALLRRIDSVGATAVDRKERKLHRVLELMARVLDQARRRVLQGEKVPAADKLVSIFEPHADILVKDNRAVRYGHKVMLTGGRSSLILDCVIEQGNPADSTLVARTLERHVGLFGSAPRQACFDGGFASRDNVQRAKALGVEDIAFHRKAGLEISEMVRSAWIFRRLRNFRSGIEGCISTLKRAFQMDRCSWRGAASFRAYVWACVTSFNLLALARHRLARSLR